MNTNTKRTRKGFTITELVIVIAVIAILAAVLIPTFANVISRANKSATMQEARGEWSNFQAEAILKEGEKPDGYLVVVYEDKDKTTAEASYIVIDQHFDPEQTAVTTEGKVQTSGTVTVDSVSYTIGTAITDKTNDYNNYEYESDRIQIMPLTVSTTNSTEEGAGA